MPFSLEEIRAEKARRAALRAKGQDPMAQTAEAPEQVIQGRPKGTIFTDLLDKINPKLTNSLVGGLQGFATGKPPETGDDDLVKTYNQEMIKKKLEPQIDRDLKEARLTALKAGVTTDEQGNIIKTSDVARDEREGRLRDFEIRRQGGNLRGELNQNQYIKRFREMNSAASGIDSILKDTLARPDNQSKNIGDQALITLYNKILDPLSVVRESEYARTPDGQALINRIAGFVQKVQSGGAGLTDSDRLEIARAAKVLINNGGELYNQQLNQYKDLSGVYGIPEEMVMTGFQNFSPYNIDEQYATGQQPPQASQVSAQTDQNDPVIRTGVDKDTKRRVGQTQSGKLVYL